MLLPFQRNSFRPGPLLPCIMYSASTFPDDENSFFMTGGYEMCNFADTDAVFRFDETNYSWQKASWKLEAPRSGHVNIVVKNAPDNLC